MDADNDILGSVTSLGLGRLLASEGVDPNALSNLLERTGGPSSRQFADVDAGADSEEEKYMDDVSDTELPAETAEDQQARARERAEEARYRRKAMEYGKRLAEEGVKVKEKKDEGDEVKRVWPDFEKGKRLRMTEIFYETPATKQAYTVSLSRKKRRRVERETIYSLQGPRSVQDLTRVFMQPMEGLPPNRIDQPLYQTPLGANFDKDWVKQAKDLLRRQMTRPPDDVKLDQGADVWQEAEAKTLDLAEWENDIIMCTLDPSPPKRTSEPLAPRNDILNSGDWLKDVIWDATRIQPDLIEEDDDMPSDKLKVAGGPSAKADPFDISNDHLYEHSREARFRIRQTFGAIEVFHAYPAKKLQIPFYKTSLTKAETRAWRRPALQFPTGISITFHKLKSNPSASVSSKKKQISADPSERFKTTKDLTLSEKGPYVLLEFSEEYPPLMSGYGMGTTIVNYYRKKDDKDETVPKLEFGQPSVINVGDAEPFLLGYVDKGKVTQVIHNNLLRAPIFRHEPETTDFLVIRQTINGHATYYIRAIHHLYTVGQTVPNESEVPGPHARKNTTTAKTRLMIVAWLLLQKSKQKKLKLTKLMKYFPDQTELQMRQRLKVKGNEFLIYARHPSPHVGYWLLNEDYDFPKERKEVLELCTPEAAMLYEAMQAGQRHLYDLGYTKTAEGNADEDAGDDSTLDIEQQLAVWSTTKNYKIAESSKAWLTLHGPGDPTGRGEGFSFLRANMKNYFLRKGETEAGRRIEAQSMGQVKISNTLQNQIYEEEKRKIWDLQWNALSNPVPPELQPEDEDKAAPTPAGLGPRFGRGDSRRAASRGQSMAATPIGESPREMSPSQYSADGESHFTGNPIAGKVLRITRKVKGKEMVEIVRDPAVIQSYMKRVEEKTILEFMKNPESLQPTGDPEKDELKRIALQKGIEKFKKNQERRLARKKYEARQDPAMFFDQTEGDGKRRCGACGAWGHTKANRNCPKYNANAIEPSPIATTPAIPTPGGYGDYFAQTPTGSEPQTPATSFKIRLGTGAK